MECVPCANVLAQISKLVLYPDIKVATVPIDDHPVIVTADHPPMLRIRKAVTLAFTDMVISVLLEFPPLTVSEPSVPINHSESLAN